MTKDEITGKRYQDKARKISFI